MSRPLNMASQLMPCHHDMSFQDFPSPTLDNITRPDLHLTPLQHATCAGTQLLDGLSHSTDFRSVPQERKERVPWAKHRIRTHLSVSDHS
jgi:hypothetical protein